MEGRQDDPIRKVTNNLEYAVLSLVENPANPNRNLKLTYKFCLRDYQCIRKIPSSKHKILTKRENKY